MNNLFFLYFALNYSVFLYITVNNKNYYKIYENFYFFIYFFDLFLFYFYIIIIIIFIHNYMII